MIFNTHAGHNPDGKTGCGAVGLIYESTENRNVNAELIRQLKALGHTVYDCTVNDGTSSSNVLTKIVQKCNAHSVDYDISIHFNAAANDKTGNGKTTGTEVYIYDLNDTTTKNKAAAICKEISALGFKNRGVKARPELYVIKNTKAKAMLIECCFVDDKDDVDLYKKVGVTKFVAAIVKGLTGQVLQESSNNNTTTTTAGKEYKVVAEINKYSTAADAAAQTNSKGKYAAGTYYIYNKYPNGSNGMYNISTDKTGASAGSWINPNENIVKQTTTITTEVKKLYRVRKSKDDEKSQVGAYSSLDNAKAACQTAGAGYHVFDWDYKIVYSYTAPVVEETKKEEIKEEVKVIAVYDLDYPEKNLIVNKAIVTTEGINQIDCTKVIKKIISNNSSFDIEIAKAFFKLASKYGIDPMMAIAQSILETGWFKYENSAVKAEQHNYCGLGVTSNGVTGGVFDTIEDGVTAQLQHLFAYGCKDALPAGEKVLDPRFNLVTRGIAPYWQQLAGRWAVPGYDKNKYDTPEKAMAAGNTYGQKIRTIYTQLCAVTVSEEDVQKYFQTIKEEEQVKPEVDTTEKEPVVVEPDVIEPEDNKEDKASSLAELIFNVIKKLVKMFADLFSKGE